MSKENFDNSNTDSEINFDINPNIIIGRYNEIGLKSRPVRARMEKSLLQAARIISKREGLNLLKQRRISGRLLFYYPHEEILNAQKVFRYLIGLHSFGLGIEIENDYDIIKKVSINFAKKFFPNNTTFAVRARREKFFPVKSMDIEREIGSLIFKTGKENNYRWAVDLKNPINTLHIEIRKTGTLIFGQIQPTIWGGNPLEYDKAMVSSWINFDSNSAAIATLMMLRRGVNTIPIIDLNLNLDYNKMNNIKKLKVDDIKTKFEKDKRFHDLLLVSKFYPNSYPIIIVSSDKVKKIKDIFISLFNKINTSDNININNIKWLDRFFGLLIAEYVSRHLPPEQRIKYLGHSLYFKGIVSSIDPRNLVLLTLGQQMIQPHLIPTSAFTDDDLRRVYISLKKLIETPNDEINSIKNIDNDKIPSKNILSEYSDIIIKSIDLEKLEEIHFENHSPSLSDKEKFLIINSAEIQNLVSIFRKTLSHENIQGILGELSKDARIFHIKGQIL